MSSSSIAESILEDRKHLPSQDRWIKLTTLISVCASIFMLPLDYTIVAVALHDIQLDLKASFGRPSMGRERLHADLRRISSGRRNVR